MSTPVTAYLEARCRSLADEIEQLGTYFGLAGRPRNMVAELVWAKDTLRILADGLEINEDFPLFATVTINAIEMERIKAWRAAAPASVRKARK